MPSKTNICNRALNAIGAQLISSIEDSNAKSAQRLSLVWEGCVKDLLAMHPWNFARAHKTLALETSAPDYTYDNAYTLPTDCVRALHLVDEDDEFEVVENRLVYTDIDDAELIYTKHVENPSYYTESFSWALAYRLAMEIAVAISMDKGTYDVVARKFEFYVAEAKLVDAVEGNPEEDDEDNIFLDARL